MYYSAAVCSYQRYRIVQVRLYQLLEEGKPLTTFDHDTVNFFNLEHYGNEVEKLEEGFDQLFGDRFESTLGQVLEQDYKI